MSNGSSAAASHNNSSSSSSNHDKLSETRPMDFSGPEMPAEPEQLNCNAHHSEVSPKRVCIETSDSERGVIQVSHEAAAAAAAAASASSGSHSPPLTEHFLAELALKSSSSSSSSSSLSLSQSGNNRQPNGKEDWADAPAAPRRFFGILMEVLVALTSICRQRNGQFAFFIDVFAPKELDIDAQLEHLRDIFHSFFVSVIPPASADPTPSEIAAAAAAAAAAAQVDDDVLPEEALPDTTADSAAATSATTTTATPATTTPSLRAISTRDLHNGRVKNKFLLLTAMSGDVSVLLKEIGNCLATSNAHR